MENLAVGTKVLVTDQTPQVHAATWGDGTGYPVGAVGYLVEVRQWCPTKRWPSAVRVILDVS